MCVWGGGGGGGAISNCAVCLGWGFTVPSQNCLPEYAVLDGISEISVCLVGGPRTHIRMNPPDTCHDGRSFRLGRPSDLGDESG